MSQRNCTAKTVKYQHLTEAERKIIERQTELGAPKRQTARLLGRNISTVRREIKRASVMQRKTKQSARVRMIPDTRNTTDILSMRNSVNIRTTVCIAARNAK